MVFEINKNFIFIDNIQFLNFSLDLLISHNDSKHWPEEFSGDLVKLVKQKAGHWYEYMNIFEELKKKQLPDKSKFLSSLKDECISEKIFFTCN